LGSAVYVVFEGVSIVVEREDGAGVIEDLDWESSVCR